MQEIETEQVSAQRPELTPRGKIWWAVMLLYEAVSMIGILLVIFIPHPIFLIVLLCALIILLICEVVTHKVWMSSSRALFIASWFILLLPLIVYLGVFVWLLPYKPSFYNLPLTFGLLSLTGSVVIGLRNIREHWPLPQPVDYSSVPDNREQPKE